MDLYSGELLVLLGPSGSGKSILLNILGALDTATSGRVTCHGQDLTVVEDRQLIEYRRFHVGFVFQFHNLIPNLTALENVEIVTEIAKGPMSPEDALSPVIFLGVAVFFLATLKAAKEDLIVATAEAEYTVSEFERITELFSGAFVSEGEMEQAGTRARIARANRRSSMFAVDVARFEFEAASTALK